MSKIIVYIAFWLMSLCALSMHAQEVEKAGKAEKDSLDALATAKEAIVSEERALLKKEVEVINAKIANETISKDEAQRQKEALAKKHAANIEDRIQILENKYAILERNKGNTLYKGKASKVHIAVGGEDGDDYLFGVNISNANKKQKYDQRTYSGPVFAVGFNNVLIDGQALDDSPYKFGGSRFFEMGWNWKTRVLKNSNFLRFSYGLSMQFNGLKPTENQVFVNNEGQTVLEEFPFELKKSKFRMDNLVIPLHLEFGGSEVKKSEEKIRYETRKKFKFGIGGFAGFNLNTRQKLKYTNADGERVKEKIKKDYNRSGLIYGLSSYIGFGDTALYVKYDLSPIFKNALVDQRNISLGLRFEL